MNETEQIKLKNTQCPATNKPRCISRYQPKLEGKQAHHVYGSTALTGVWLRAEELEINATP